MAARSIQPSQIAAASLVMITAPLSCVLPQEKSRGGMHAGNPEDDVAEGEPGPNSEYVALGRVRLGGCHGEDSKRAAELVGLNNPRAAEIGATRARAAPCAAIRALPLLLHGASL
jgi:hypothetical protein